jgi:hypothetical protein
VSDPIPPLLSCAALLLASAAILLNLGRTALPAPAPTRLATPPFHVTPVRPGPRPYFARHTELLPAEANRSVRPYVVAAEQAVRRQEPEPMLLELSGAGPYVMHGIGVA